MKTLTILTIASVALLTGCESIRSIGLEGRYTDERGRTAAGRIDVGLRDGKSIIPPDGPDTVQTFDANGNPNFGSK